MPISISADEVRECFPSLTSHLDTSTIETFITIARTRSYPKNSIIIQDNSTSQKLYFLLKGSLNTSINKNGKKIRLNETRPGDFIGEVSMFGNCPTTATVTASTDSEMLVIDREELNRLQVLAPDFVNRLLREISKTLTKRLLNTDKLLCKGFINTPDNSTTPAHAWYTSLYQRMHGHIEA